jgi:ParB-like chromosome segregation protein Spo0J
MRDDKYRDVIPKISEEAYHALKASIREHGMLEAIVLDGDGAIADGHNRHRAYLELQTEGVNVKLKTRMENFADEAAARSFIRAVNIARRQLSTKDKRDLIDAELRENPSDSDNAIAKRLGVSDKTVAARRQKLQSGSEFPNPSKRTGRDGKPQSATKRTRRRRQKPAQDAEADNSGQELPGPDSDAAALEPEQPEPISGDGINEVELPQTDPTMAGDYAETPDDAARIVLRAVWADASEHGRPAGKVDLINAGCKLLTAKVRMDTEEFFAWLRGEGKAEDFEAAADRLN